jgi:hypothetical protein
MSPFATILAGLILSGDVDSAETYLHGWCEGRVWTHAEVIAIRNACAKWGVDAARFGAGRKPIVCPPELWPVRASFIAGEVPVYPTDEQFQVSTMQATNHFPEVAYVWRSEAIRWRRCNFGQVLDLPAIQAATERAIARLAARAA